MDKQDKIGVSIITALCIAIILAIFSAVIYLVGLTN